MMKRLNVDIKDCIYNDFLKQAEMDGRSISDIIRLMILDYIENRSSVRSFAKNKEIENVRRKDW